MRSSEQVEATGRASDSCVPVQEGARQALVLQVACLRRRSASLALQRQSRQHLQMLAWMGLRFAWQSRAWPCLLY
jgi:hypothetical protein